MKLLVPIDQTTLSDSILRVVERTVLPMIDEVHLLAVLNKRNVKRAKRGEEMEWSHEMAPREGAWAIYPLYLSEDQIPGVLPEGPERQISDDDLRVNARSYLVSAASRFADDVEIVPVVIEDQDPPKAIIEYGRQERVDLIAMATHARSGLSRAVLGSVTDEVIRSAIAPVLVCASADR
ncbi:MAG TPA: universal stress protein [Dehalococcoidia bacterium]|nr:universal stress protein [Dehalococcoidia bacterium]